MKYLLIVLAGCASVAGAANSPEDLIRRLYDAHQIWTKNHYIHFGNRAQLGRYFDNELVELFIRDDRCMRDSGAICSIDADPLLCAQDYLAEDPSVKISPSFERPFTHDVTLNSLKGKRVLLEMKRTAIGWRVSDIKCPEFTFTLKQALSEGTKGQ